MLTSHPISAIGCGTRALRGWVRALTRSPVLIALVQAATSLEGPALQAVVTELVGRAELPVAVALNSVGYNLARAVGPAMDGIILARASVGANLFVNSLTFFVVLIVFIASSQ